MQSDLIYAYALLRRVPRAARDLAVPPSLARTPRMPRIASLLTFQLAPLIDQVRLTRHAYNFLMVMQVYTFFWS